MAARKTRPKPTPQHLISTRMSGGQCGRCAARVLTGHVMGTRTVLDPMALTLTGEALALVAGLRTFQISTIARDGIAMMRNVGMIRRGLPEYDRVHTEHRCGADWQAQRDTREMFAPMASEGDECPF